MRSSDRCACLPAANYPDTAASDASSASCDIVGVLESWLSNLSEALRTRNPTLLASLFFEESYFRDHLVLSWDFRTIKDSTAIANFILQAHVRDKPANLRVELDTEVAADQRLKHTPIDKNGKLTGAAAFLKIETVDGLGRGYTRLLQDVRDGKWKAFTLFTSLCEIKGRPESIKHARPNGYGRRGHERNLANGHLSSGIQNDPCVLIVGAGQAGLTTAARLAQLGVSALVIDKKARVGDNWRDRYKGLVLHDPVWYNHLPYMPFPESWPVFTPKNKLANWFELYTQALDLNVWTSAVIQEAKWTGNNWCVTVAKKLPNGCDEILRMEPKHIVQATGQAGHINIPRIDGIDTFQGSRICHSSHFEGVQAPGNGEKVVVIGSGTSAHDIAHDYSVHGYDVTMIQRSSTCVDPTEYSKGKDLYREGGPLTEDADLVTQSLPTAVSKRNQIEVTDRLYIEHKEFFANLHKVGFVTDRGPEGAGRKLKYLDSGGGYYIDVGASSLIIDGRIKVRHGLDVSRIEAHAVTLADGSNLPAEQIILATGFTSMRESARLIFGDEVASCLHEVWGLDAEGELNSVWRQSGHPGFWFAGGNIAISRYFSRLLALQLLACELGIYEYRGD